MATKTKTRSREPLSTERVLRAAIALADRGGIEALSMRKLAGELGVVPMALYKHVADKDQMLDGMVETVMEEINGRVREIDARSGDWRSVMRGRVLAAREILLRHPWAPRVMETRTSVSPEMLRYFDSLVALFQGAGFSIDLTHHALHAMGSRALGFTQELYEDSGELDADATEAFVRQMADRYPHIAGMISLISHDADTTLGWCDDQFEFEFALDLMLDGLDRLRRAGPSDR
jgi:AcrR family transcriptional regulator